MDPLCFYSECVAAKRASILWFVFVVDCSTTKITTYSSIKKENQHDRKTITIVCCEQLESPLRTIEKSVTNNAKVSYEHFQSSLRTMPKFVTYKREGKEAPRGIINISLEGEKSNQRHSRLRIAYILKHLKR